jgi:hypothetical protein
MSTDNKVQAVTSNGEIKETELQATALTVSQAQLKEIHKRAENLSNMSAGVSLNPRYYEFENAGDTVRGVFLGFKQLTMTDRATGKPKAVNAVMWMDETKSVFVNAGASLVGIFTEVDVPQFHGVQIEYTGETKTKSGNNVKIYDVRILQ